MLLPATEKCWKHSWKPFRESHFGSVVTFLIMSVTSQQRRSYSADFSRGNRCKSAAAKSVEHCGCSSIVTLFFAKKSLTKTDRCAGELSWRRNHQLVVHISERFLLTASLRRITNLWKRYSLMQQFPWILPANSGNFLKLLRIKPFVVYWVREWYRVFD